MSNSSSYCCAIYCGILIGTIALPSAMMMGIFVTLMICSLLVGILLGLDILVTAEIALLVLMMLICDFDAMSMSLLI